MTVTFEQKEIERIIHYALCNGGLSQLASYGLFLDLKKSEYVRHRKEEDCFEDVLSRILNSGGRLNFEDQEGGEDASFNLEEAIERLNSATEYTHNMVNILKGEDDAYDGDNVLQICLYSEVQFG